MGTAVSKLTNQVDVTVEPMAIHVSVLYVCDNANEKQNIVMTQILLQKHLRVPGRFIYSRNAV